MRKITSQADQAEQFPSTVTYRLSLEERQALATLSGKLLRRKGDHRSMMLLITRCALAHWDNLAPYFEAGMRYAKAEALDPHCLWHVPFVRKAVRK